MTESEDVLKERRRCIGLVLAEYGIQKAGGRDTVAQVLDSLATQMEHPNPLPHPND